MTEVASLRIPVVGEVLSPTHAKSILHKRMRVLHVQGGDEGRILLIEIEPIQSHGRKYFRGPKTFELAKVQEDQRLKRSTIIKGGVAPRPDVVANDKDLDKKYLRRGETISGPRKAREERWEILGPLVKDHDKRQLLFDPQVRREKIAVRAAELAPDKRDINRKKKQISGLLNMFWAGGSTREALTPFSDTKGARGKARLQKNKLGRQNLPTRQGKQGEQGFIMSEEDKDICGFAWRNYYVPGKTKAKALRRMWREFYSSVTINAKGKAVHKLLPVGDRPTRKQFERWGQQRSPGHESWKAQFTKLSLARLDRILLGTANETVTAVGQLGAIDSTSPDINFISVLNRLKRIGGAHRVLIIDSKYGYIPGFYLGLDAPSAKTVRLAVLHALSDKASWLKWLGLDDQDPNQWLQIQFARILGDNTDLRCEEVEQCLESIGCGLQFVGVARSDLNSIVESGHHILHRSTDHNLHGTTFGRKKERGEKSSDELARHTILEAIRETARAIYAHNTMELDMIPSLAAHRELVEKGIKLTRANLTRWDIERGKVSCSLISSDEARMKLLMPIRGTFTKRGVKLLRSDRGSKREFVEPAWYVAKNKEVITRTLKAKVARGRARPEDFDDDFLHNPYEPRQIFYREPVSGELIALDAKVPTDDSERLQECSFPDMVELMDAGALDRYNARVSQDEALSNLEDGQDRTKEDAATAYQEALDAAPRKPSKAAMKKNKKENREAEKATYMYGMPTMPPETTASIADTKTSNDAPEEPRTDPVAEPELETPSRVTPDIAPLPSFEPSASPLIKAILERIAERSRNA